jgi:hypothetical protein
VLFTRRLESILNSLPVLCENAESGEGKRAGDKLDEVLSVGVIIGNGFESQRMERWERELTEYEDFLAIHQLETLKTRMDNVSPQWML